MEEKIEGLTEQEVILSRKKYGSNELNNQSTNSFLSLFLETLKDPIIRILLIALVVKTVVLFKNFDWYETIGILISIFVASLISSLSEYGSEKAFKRMQDEASKLKCKVKREGKLKEIFISEVVKGDIIKLAVGDKIPADGILISGEVVVDESHLTGESIEIYKNQKNNKLYRGSVIYQKMGYMKVTEVGENTFYGRIFKEVEEKKPESPLKKRLHELAKTISKIGYIGAILGAISYLFSVIILNNNFNFELIKETITNFPLMSSYLIYALTLAITIIILAVPEGLPVMITLVLSSNMKRMLKDQVLIRKLTGIETAGNLNLLFFDKTGTITKGTPQVHLFLDGKLKEYKSINDLKRSSLFQIIKISSLKNNEGVIENGKVIGGNSTDKAILEYMINEKSNVKVINHLPFDSKNKYTKTKVIIDEKEVVLLKGAYEKLLPFCNSYFDGYSKTNFINKFRIEQFIKKYENEGLRVVMLATTDESFLKDDYERAVLLGFYIIKDEVRKEAKETIEELENSGIKTIMITGDNKETAMSIAKEVSLLKNKDDIVLTSNELNKKSDQEIIKMLPFIKVIARALPTDKSRLVNIAIKSGYVTGMTGDGVNDAPALKKANVGFSMGSGTEVSKEASDIVILDNNIKSISKAILYGRTIFKSIRKFIIFQLSLNICAVFVSVIAPILGIDTPVTVIQMLWINMIMDSLAALAFSYEAPLKEYMKEPPKKQNESIINTYMKQEIALTGIYSGILCLLFLKLDYFKIFFRESPTNDYLLTAFFGLFIFIGIFNSFNARTPRLNLLSNLSYNKVFLAIFSFIILIQLYLIYFGGNLFRSYGLTLKELEIMLLLAFSVIPIDLLRKIVIRKQKYEKDV